MAHDDSAALISDAFVDDVRGLQAELFELQLQSKFRVLCGILCSFGVSVAWLTRLQEEL